MNKDFKELIEITKKLREKCPWDKEQNFESLKSTILEETQEVIEAIDNKDYLNLKEELGDLLHNILFLSNISEEKNLFSIKDVIADIKAKLIRRHPHVFGNEKALTPEDSMRIWKRVKEEEKRLKKEAVKNG